MGLEATGPNEELFGNLNGTEAPSISDRCQSRPFLIASTPTNRPTPKAIPSAVYGWARTALSAVLAAATVFSSRRWQVPLAFSMASSSFARRSVFSLASLVSAFIPLYSVFALVRVYVSATAGCRVPPLLITLRANARSVTEATDSQELACQRRTGDGARFFERAKTRAAAVCTLLTREAAYMAHLHPQRRITGIWHGRCICIH